MKSKLAKTARYEITNLQSLPAVDCSCGKARRAFTDDPEKIASLHLVDIRVEAKTHYHKKSSEIYHVLEGNGQVELDGHRFDVGPGSTIIIKPHCRHRAIGNLKILNVSIPAFDPEDEYMV